MGDTLVLCYHAVSEQWPADLSVRPSDFRDQIASLVGKGYAGVTFSEAATKSSRGRRLAVTFDDGYRSVVELAAPLLADLGVPATVFVPTDYLGREDVMSWPGIDQWVGGVHHEELLPMTWDDARSLIDAGWEIGSHTCSHPRLTGLDDRALGEEMRESRRVCEERLSLPCSSIAYPYGDVDRRVVQAARDAGYVAGGALPARWRAPAPLEWPRAGIWHTDDHARFRVKTSPAVRRLRTLIRR